MKACIKLLIKLFFVSTIMLCFVLIGCNTSGNAKEQDGTVTLLSFDSVEELKGTAPRYFSQIKTSINTESRYITQGKGSLRVEPAGDYGDPDYRPTLQFQCNNTTFGSSDFSNISEVSVDVYNATNKELNIALKWKALDNTGSVKGVPSVRYTLASNSWTTCNYNIDDNMSRAYFDAAEMRYFIIEFFEHKTSKDDTVNVLYFDNLYIF